MADEHPSTPSSAPEPPPGYVLGHSDTELRRLESQARVKNPITRRFLVEAGIAPGMRVLDVGSGGGDVTLLLADLVGESGEVVGVDRSEAGLEVARAKVAARSLTNVTFVAGAADQVTFDDPFDAVAGRYVLQFQDDPATLLAAVAAQLRPGGLVVFHELDWSGVRSTPPAPTFERLRGWLEAAIERSGASAHMGLGLPAAFAAAGLPDPVMRLEALVGSGVHARELLEIIGNLARTLAPTLEEYGIVTERELDLGTLVDRMDAEVLAGRAVITMHTDVGAWARVARR